jgi:inhibitor of KinA sporulation pathway (predicted exonuclease)
VTSDPEVDSANEQEIYQFPWVVFDVASKQVVDEKSVYVKPVLHESLGVKCAKASLGDEAASNLDTAGTLQQAVQVRSPSVQALDFRWRGRSFHGAADSTTPER